jgi:hypothetical protein
MFLIVGTLTDLFAQTNENKSTEKSIQLKFDGLYRTDKLTNKNDASYQYYSYFRFCENGKVVGMSSTFSVKQVSKWLKCEKDGVQKYSVGEYKIKDSQISFITKSESGKVDYEGIIQNNSIKLNSFSHINNNSEKNKEFKFIQAKFDEK